MARLIAASVTAAAVFALLSAGSADTSPKRQRGDIPSLALRAGGEEPAKQQGRAQAEFKAAGVCARCHVISVLEWGISKHVAANTTCQKCHGPSKEHVAKDRKSTRLNSSHR